MKQKHALLSVFVLIIMALTACTPTPENAMKCDAMPPIYPDYTDITIPCNIAPLNFLLRDEVDAVEVRAVCDAETLMVNTKGNEVCYGLKE